MGNNMLIDELHRIQVEYRSVLENALKNIYKKESNSLLLNMIMTVNRLKRRILYRQLQSIAMI
jgi:hypothetical protein